MKKCEEQHTLKYEPEDWSHMVKKLVKFKIVKIQKLSGNEEPRYVVLLEGKTLAIAGNSASKTVHEGHFYE